MSVAEQNLNFLTSLIDEDDYHSDSSSGGDDIPDVN